MKKYINLLLEIMPFSLVFLTAIRFPSDSDLGWHLKQGEYFAQTLKIMDTNIYSQLMPGFHYRNYTWLTDLLEYTVFHLFSFWGIAILGALTITLIYFFLSKAANLNFWQKAITFPIIIFLTDIILRVSFRGQALSLVFVAIIIYLLSIFEKYPKKVIIATAIIMLLWANTHAQFILAPIIIALWIFCKGFNEIQESRKIKLKNYKYPSLLLAASIIPTIVNPYGPYVYLSILAHFYNPEVLSKVNEWISPFTEKETLKIFLSSAVFYVLSVGYLIYKKQLKKYLFYILLPLPLFIQAATYTRYLWIAIFLLIPLMGFAVEFFKPKEIKYQQLIAGSILAAVYIYAIYTFPVRNFVNPTWETHCIYLRCSDKAVKYVLDNNLNNDKLFTQFEYGGWLIWNHPEVKPTIDGRMHTWNDNGYSGFLDYYQYEQAKKSIDESRYNTALVGKRKPVTKVLAELAKQKKWVLVYDDFYNQIYIRNK